MKEFRALAVAILEYMRTESYHQGKLAERKIDTIIASHAPDLVETCPACRGRGSSIDGTGPRMTREKCDDCNGRGVIYHDPPQG